MMSESIAIVWHRRDLRLKDNAAAYHALKNHERVLPIFIFDKNILDQLPEKADRRVTFIHREISRIKKELEEMDSSLKIFYSSPEKAFEQLLNSYNIEAVYTNRDYEPYARQRDSEIEKLLKEKGIAFHSFKDQCIFEKDEVLKKDGGWYSVFTPYSRVWKDLLQDSDLKPYPNEKYFGHYLKSKVLPEISLEEMGFEEKSDHIPDADLPKKIIENYHNTRDLPAEQGTTRMSVHLRFGIVSIRQLAKKGLELNEKWLNELIWRDFYMMILWYNPHVVKSAFRPKYDAIPWRNNEKEFEAWQKGETGYPLVDAGMRELNETGFMHNRVRMVTASFLCKHLLIDWRWGEQYFADKLLDFELSSNNGGWQWAAGTGCDAAPYFRVFNPSSQAKKFDPQSKYIKKWVPEIWEGDYVSPIVEHKMARARALKTYKSVLG
ncbi:MAG: deoxyribodipyrimidine photo-lyase [Chitinophagales bacterium]